MHLGIITKNGKSVLRQYRIKTGHLLVFFVILSAMFSCMGLRAKAGDAYSLTEDKELTAAELTALLSSDDYDYIETNSYTLTVTGDVSIAKAIYVGEDGKLEVNGNLTTSDVVNVAERGSIVVTGDYTHNKVGFGGIGVDATVNVAGTFTFSGTGFVYSTNEYAVINVGKDLVFDTTVDMNYNQATWNVSGNVAQKREKGGSIYLNKLVMTGEGDKSLLLQSNGNVRGLYLENGMELDVPLYYNCDNVNSDITIKTGDKTVFVGIGIPEEKKITIEGNMVVIEGSVSVADGASLKINGDFTQKKDGFGGIGANATVDVAGMVTFSGTGYVYSTNEFAVINVGKDLVFDTTVDMNYNQATWNVSGNVAQKREKGGSIYLNKLVMTGEGDKSLLLQSNGNVRGLYLENGMELDVPLYYNCGNVNTDITIKTGDKTAFVGISIPEERNITIDGNMVVTDGEFYIADSSIIKVKGNFAQKKGAFGGIGANAKVDVDGSLTFSGTGFVNSTNEKALITVGKDLVYESVTDTNVNNATWVVSGNVLQQDKSGKLDFNRLEMRTKDTDVTIRNGMVSVLVLSYGKSHFDIFSDDCYEKLIATSVVTLDAGEGKVTPQTLTVTTDELYGALPVPEFDGRSFLGWFTEEEDGEVVNDSTKVTAVDDHTLYAHWGDGLKEGEERISPEDKDKVKTGEPGSKTVTKSIKLSKKEKINVSVSVNYLNNVAVYTGKKIDVVNILVPSIDLTPLMELVELQEGTTASDFFIVDYMTKNIKAGDAKFYAKISLTKDAKNRMSKADLKKLKKIIKGVNSALKADPCAYWINPASVLDCDAKVIVKLKAGKIQLKKDGSLKNIKKVTVTIGDKTYKLTKKSYELSGVDEAAGTVKLKGKGNFTGTVIVEINK